MLGSSLLDVAIGMVFIYLLLSLICSAANEIIEGWLKNRATDLERGIRELLEPDSNGKVSNTGIVADLYKHALVNGLYKGTYDKFAEYKGKKFFLWRWLVRLFNGPALPSYIPARNFALALMDTVLPANSPAPQPPPTDTPSGAAGATRTATAANPLVVVTPAAPAAANAPATANPLESLRNAISRLPDGQTKEALLTLVDAAGNDVNKARENIEAWFNSSMDRVSGWYKRRTQLIIFVLGILVAIILNADSIVLVNTLSRDKALRDSLVAAAEAYAKANPSPTPAQANPAPSPSPSPTASPTPAPAQTTGASAGATASPAPTPHLPAECINDKNSAECKIALNRKEIEKLGLPIGWLDSGEDKYRKWPGNNWWGVGGWWQQFKWHWLGWLITALAASLGAPFWFDMLNKIIVVRSTVKPHEKSPEEHSKQ